MNPKPTIGIAVDGSCRGNPGPGEYRAVNIETKEELFRHKFQYTTNNIMEFCGIVHALKYSREKGLNFQIYSDSTTAIRCAEKKSINTSLAETEKTKMMLQFVKNCELWLLNNTKNHIPVSKWETIDWGENPADFGYKQETSITKKQLRDWILKEKFKLSNNLWKNEKIVMPVLKSLETKFDL